MLSHDEAEDILKRATFRIYLGKHDFDGVLTDFFGTGFFVSADGLALTAYHNFIGCSPNDIFEATYRGEKIGLKWLEEKSSERADIAAMHLCANPQFVEVEPLKAAFFDPALPLSARKEFFRNLGTVMIFGYPERERGGVGWRIDGCVDNGLPIIESYERDWGPVERLCIRGSRINELEGISGGAILDRETGHVIAVVVSYDVQLVETPDGKVWRGANIVMGTEVGQLVVEHPDLKVFFEQISTGTDKPAPVKVNSHFAKNIKSFLTLSWIWMLENLQKIALTALSLAVFAFLLLSILFFIQPVYSAYDRGLNSDWSIRVYGDQKGVSWDPNFEDRSRKRGLLIEFQEVREGQEVVLISNGSNEENGVNVAQLLGLHGNGARLYLRIRNIGGDAKIITRVGGGNNDSIQFGRIGVFDLKQGVIGTYWIPDRSKDAFHSKDLRNVVIALGLRLQRLGSQKNVKILVEEISFRRVINLFPWNLMILLVLIASGTLFYWVSHRKSKVKLKQMCNLTPHNVFSDNGQRWR